MIDKKIITIEGIKNNTNSNILNINNFSQEIITDGEIIKIENYQLNNLSDEEQQILYNISNYIKKNSYKLIKNIYYITNANYVLRIYYENLELSSYLCRIKDIDIYMKNIEDKDKLKKIKEILNKKINKYSKMHYINPILLNNIIKKPITYIRQKAKKL